MEAIFDYSSRNWKRWNHEDPVSTVVVQFGRKASQTHDERVLSLRKKGLHRMKSACPLRSNG